MSSNEHKNHLVDKIIEVTVKIQKRFPELYCQLHETPVTFYHKSHVISAEEYHCYLESLILQLLTFETDSRSAYRIKT